MGWYENEAKRLRIDLIESVELKARLKAHGKFLDLQGEKINLYPNLLFDRHICDYIEQKSEIFGANAIDDSILGIIVKAFERMSVSREEVEKQISEISHSEFSEAIDTFHWTLYNELLGHDYSSWTLLELVKFYFSYALSLLSVRKTLSLISEMKKIDENGDTMTFEKLLTFAEMVAEEQYKDQPIAWTLQLL